MDRTSLLRILVGSLAAARSTFAAAAETIHLGKRGLDIDYASYLGKHDIVYLSPAREGYLAPLS